MTKRSVGKIHSDWASNPPKQVMVDWNKSPIEYKKLHVDWDQPQLVARIRKIHTDWNQTIVDFPQGDWHLPLQWTPLTKNVRLNSEQKKFRQLTYPHSGDYPSITPAIFLTFIPNLKALNKHPLIVARDGAIPLAKFFEKFKTPKSLKAKIAIHEDLLWLAPDAWRKSLASYRVVGSKLGPEKTNIFIYGINSQALISVAQCDKILSNIKTRINEATKIYLCLPSHYLSATEPIQMHAEMARIVFSKIGTDVTVCDWGQFMQKDLSDTCLAVNLNKDTLISDCWLTQTLLQAGAGLPTLPLQAGEKLVPVSRSHGFALNMKPKYPRLTSKQVNDQKDSLFSSYEASILDWKKFLKSK